MQSKLHVFSLTPALLVLLAGCQSTGVDTATATTKSLKEVKAALATSEAKVDNLVQSLNALAKVQGDMKSQWRIYDRAVNAVEADSARVAALREDAKTNKQDYLRGWDERMRTIRDADLRVRAEERRDAAAEGFDELSKQADEARNNYEKWMVAANDIRTYLESDLNPAGVKSVADKIETVNEGADALKKEITDVIGELDKVIASMNAVVPAEEASK